MYCRMATSSAPKRCIRLREFPFGVFFLSYRRATKKRNVFSSLKYQTNIAGISKIRFTRPAISLIIAPQS